MPLCEQQQMHVENVFFQMPQKKMKVGSEQVKLNVGQQTKLNFPLDWWCW